MFVRRVQVFGPASDTWNDTPTSCLSIGIQDYALRGGYAIELWSKAPAFGQWSVFATVPGVRVTGHPSAGSAARGGLLRGRAAPARTGPPRGVEDVRALSPERARVPGRDLRLHPAAFALVAAPVRRPGGPSLVLRAEGRPGGVERRYHGLGARGGMAAASRAPRRRRPKPADSWSFPGITTSRSPWRPTRRPMGGSSWPTRSGAAPLPDTSSPTSRFPSRVSRRSVGRAPRDAPALRGLRARL